LVRFAVHAARDAGADAAAQHDVRLAVDEVCTNIIEHGYGGAAGSIAIEVTVSGEALHIRIEDQAPLFDPTTAPRPDLHIPWEQRTPGKLGWHLTREVMDDVRYEPRAERGNVVTLVKHLTQQP
jgi:anti-sigma regulatory factor (Ser/Thr protein kinase)